MPAGFPAAKQDADPFEGEASHRPVVGLAVGALCVVVCPSPFRSRESLSHEVEAAALLVPRYVQTLVVLPERVLRNAQRLIVFMGPEAPRIGAGVPLTARELSAVRNGTTAGPSARQSSGVLSGTAAQS